MNFKKHWISTAVIFLLIGYVFQFVTVTQAQGDTTVVQAVAWSPNGSQIAMGGFDNSIPILAVRNADMSLVLDLASVPGGQTRQILSVSWSPDSKYLASGSVDGTIAIWAINDPLRTTG